MFRILVVCAANVCRSPTAELLIRHELAEHQLDGSFSVQCAGIAAPERMPRCPVAAKYVQRRGVDPATMLEQTPRSVSSDDIGEAGLILGADRGVTADVLRLAPQCRRNVFTFRESAVLARSASRELSARSESGVDDLSSDGYLEELVAEMDASRGVVAMPAPTRHGFRKALVSSFDLPDVHGLSSRQHRQMVDRVAGVAVVLVAAFGGLVISERRIE